MTYNHDDRNSLEENIKERDELIKKRDQWIEKYQPRIVVLNFRINSEIYRRKKAGMIKK